MNNPPYRFDKKFLIIFTIIIYIGIFVTYYIYNLNLSVFFLVIGLFVLLITQLYKDTIIPKIPKLTFLLYIIILILLISIQIIFSNETLYVGFIIILMGMGRIYKWIEDYYNENIDNSIRFKNWKKNFLLIIIIGGLILAYILIIILLYLLLR